MISALVLTYNEERIIGKCLAALDFVDQIVILDSYSTDNTVDIAISYKAKIIQRPFDDYANQRNAGLKAIDSKYNWVLMVDADEIVTSELQHEIIETISQKTETTMFRVRRKDMFQNKWIKHASGYPTWFPRLFKNGSVTVDREINEEYITDGIEGKLYSHLLHYPFNKGITHWFKKHNLYSTMEAIKMRSEISESLQIAKLFSLDSITRRKTQKRLSYRLPFRPFFVFIAFYILKGGFLDGKAGYIYCKLRKTYEWMIELKVKELKDQEENIR